VSGATDERLLIFARTPIPGRVKTRLIPALGASGACEFHRACVLDVAERHRRSAPPGRSVVVVRADAPTDPFWDEVGGEQTDQHGLDLGARMANALADALRIARRVVIIGTDSPTLPPARIDAAFAALDRVEVVLGPAIDGGYYLIGARDEVPPCFLGPEWGGERVLADTVDLLVRAGLRYERLEPCFDVDHPADLERLHHALADLRRIGGALPARVARLLEHLPAQVENARSSGAHGAEETP
jgi:rSAM/selenodomain-associated transferase 1